MNESTRILNEIFRKHNVSGPEFVYWLYMILERMTQDYREDYLDDLGEKEIKSANKFANRIANENAN